MAKLQLYKLNMNCAASLFDVRNAQLSGIESEAINKIDIYTNVHKCNHRKLLYICALSHQNYDNVGKV